MSAHNRVDLTGARFGRLTVTGYAGRNASGNSVWDCICDCGNPTKAHTAYLRSGRKASCGCIRVEKVRSLRPAKLGGLCAAHRRAYNIWRQMMRRCHDRKSSSYRDYGGRGIGVAAEWKEFSAFVADMGDPPEGHTLDRKNNDGNYSKENCRWATPKTQGANKRNNIFVKVDGVLMSCEKAAGLLGLTRAGVYSRVWKGTIEKFDKNGYPI